MGFTPQQVNEMSMWQFMAAVDGYVDANTPDDGGLTAKEVDELWDWIDLGESRHPQNLNAIRVMSVDMSFKAAFKFRD